MKKYAGAFLSVVILLLLGIMLNSTVLIGQASADRIQIFVNDREIHTDVAPQIIQDRVLIPVRFIATALQAEVEWDEASKTVIITEGGKTIQLAIGQETWLNGRSVAALDVPAQIIGGRTMVPVRLVSEAFGADVQWNPDTRSVHISRTPDQKNSLPVVGSADNLKQLLFQANLNESAFGYLRKEALPALSGAKGESTQDAAANQAPAPSDYSQTNVQVAGVDEADIVKTDGTYIYQVNKQRVIIARAFPAENLKVVSRVDFADDKFRPQEIYVDKQHLVVIGQYAQDGPIRIMEDANALIYPPIPQRQTVKAIVFNIENKEQPKKEREIELEGNYVSTRKIGDSLYLIANHHIRYYPNQKEPIPLPTYRDTNRQEAFLQVDSADIRYFPDFIRPNLLMIAGLNLASPGDKVQVSTYLGAGDNVYASTENLYVAETAYRQQISITDKLDAASLKTIIQPIGEQQTQVYRFSLSNGKTVYKGSGSVPGTLLNQFSMDEFNGYFRIATTKGEPWSSRENTSKNNLYVLDADLNIVGQVEDIAPGEQIYSVRFMGNRGYLVTFKTVDPLFVVDLKDPKNPKILGALKIPGYSNYLHPYDENHIIGFGKDTVEYVRKDTQGRELGRTAYYLGMKIAVFDVSDVQNPIEKFTEKIGDRGTESELLSNHKALYFEKDKNLLAFPVTVMEVQNQKDPSNSNFPAYGSFAFQGAYIYSLDLVNGFTLQKKVTHLNAEDYLKAGDYWYQSDKNVERILRINNILYTLSKDRIKAHNLSTFEDVADLTLN
jgi:uncharacterized secreted protein with C-terminal beta-propeller domain